MVMKVEGTIVCHWTLEIVAEKRVLCCLPAWVEPDSTKPYYTHFPRPGREDARVYLCQKHALEDARNRYGTMWAEVQALAHEPGLDISEDREAFRRAANVLPVRPSRGLLIAANAKANAFVAAAQVYLEDGQNLITQKGYSGLGMEELQVRGNRVRELLEQLEIIGFRISNTPRGEYRPYEELHRLSIAVRDEGRNFYRGTVSFPERQQRLSEELVRREEQRRVREEEISRKADQKKMVEETREKLLALLEAPSSVKKSGEELFSKPELVEAEKAPKPRRKGKQRVPLAEVLEEVPAGD